MSSAIVIGAGFGGLSAAIDLAAAGVRVTVIEQAQQVGGKAGRYAEAGFTWDTGPTLLTLPEILDEKLARAGMRLASEVPLHPLSPLCRYRFAIGTTFDHHADIARTAQEIAKFSPHDAEAWPRFLAWAKEVFGLVGGAYLDVPFPGTLSFATRMARLGPRALTLGASFGSIDGLGQRFFESQELRCFVNRLATYVGGSPTQTSGSFGMIAHVESRGDAVYPVGGIHAVAQALARAATKLGVQFRLGEQVERIEQRQGWQVTTGDGAYAGDAVVLNVDPALGARLFGDKLRARLTVGEAGTRSLSGVALLLGLRGRTQGLALHNVFFPADYAGEFEDLFDRRLPPLTPAIYVAAGSQVDPAAAPPDHEALFVLVNAPPELRFDWNAEVVRLKALVIARLETLDPTFGARLTVMKALTPIDFARTGSPDGALYGLAPHGALGPFRRPAQRVSGAKGLYLAGGATHPGGGVPMATLSGSHAAQLLLQDLAPRREEVRS
jgi:phytoene desaturase